MSKRNLALAAALLVLVGLVTWLCWPPAPPRAPVPHKPARAIAARHVPKPTPARRVTAAHTAPVVTNTTPDTRCTIRGDIRRSNGDAISGAFVWIEYAEDFNYEWQLTCGRSQWMGVTDPRATDATGVFSVVAPSLTRPITVRYYVPGETYGGTDPFDEQHRPPAWLRITIPAGGRLVGVFKSSAGVPVTNVSAQLGCHSLVTNGSGYVPQRRMNYEIDEQGNYTSHVLPPGRYSLMLDAPGYGRAETRDLLAVCEGELTQCDVVFEPEEQHRYGGVIIDWHTKLPVPFVTVAYPKTEGMSEMISDGMGQFSFAAPFGYAYCSHPNYTPVSCQNLSQGTNTIVYLSKGAAVDVYVWSHTGAPFTNITVYLRGPLGDLWRFRQALHNMASASSTGNYVTFDKVPTHFAPMCAEIYAGSPERLTTMSDAFTPTVGRTTRVDVHMPPPATLVLQLASPVDPSDVRIYLYQADPAGEEDCLRHESAFVQSTSTWVCSELSCGDYRLYVTLPGLRLDTNITVTAPSTEVHIAVPPQGIIAGRVHDTAGMPIGSLPLALTGDFTSVEGERGVAVVAIARSAANGSFVIKGLDPTQRYLLQLQVSGFSNMYFPNIVPNSAPLDICLPRMARVTGVVKDAEGKLLKANVGVDDQQRLLCHGEFIMAEVFPGPHVLCVAAEGYAPLPLPITVGDIDLDVGDVIVRERGVSVRGRVVTADGAAAPGWRIHCSEGIPDGESIAAPYRQEVMSDDDGVFVLKDMPRGANVTITFMGPQREGHELRRQNVTEDLDLGDVSAPRE